MRRIVQVYLRHFGTRQKVNYKEELERTVNKIKETDLNELLESCYMKEPQNL